MTHCYNCGHTGTFVLLVEFALAVPGPVPDREAPDAHVGDRRTRPGRRTRSRRGNDRRSNRGDPHRGRRGRRDPAGFDDPPIGDAPTGRNDPGPNDPEWDRFRTRNGLPTGGDLSLAVQCPACDSTDVGVAAADLLARYESNVTS